MDPSSDPLANVCMSGVNPSAHTTPPADRDGVSTARGGGPVSEVGETATVGVPVGEGDDGHRPTSNPPSTAPPTHGSVRNATDFQQISFRRRALRVVERDPHTSAGTSSGFRAWASASSPAKWSATSVAV